MNTRILMFLFLVLLITQTSGFAQGVGVSAEPQNEVGLYQLPSDMTFEEYTAANRRFTTALMVAPLPGFVHLYVGEKSKGYSIMATVFAGAVLVGAGLGMSRSNDLQTTDYETVVINTDTYAKIPSRVEGTITHYRLKKLEKKIKPLAGTMVGVGVLAIATAYIYDIFDGLLSLEKQRNAVRFKYGKQMNEHANLFLHPEIDPQGGANLQVGVRY